MLEDFGLSVDFNFKIIFYYIIKIMIFFNCGIVDFLFLIDRLCIFFLILGEEEFCYMCM